MRENIKSVNVIIITLFLFFGILTFWSVGLTFLGLRGTLFNYYYNAITGLVYGVGGVCGLIFGHYFEKDNKKQKLLKFLGLGQISWGMAAMVWTYYAVVGNIRVPYPSMADIFYLGFTLLMALSVGLLLDYLQPKIEYKNIIELSVIILITYVIVSSVYWKPEMVAEQSIVASLLNFIYPLTDAIVFSLALLILRVSKKTDIYRPIYYLTFGLMFQVIGDVLFTYRTTAETYWNGDISDFLYMLSGFLISFGILKLVAHRK